MIPCCRIDSTSSCSASRPKSFRGCSALGTTLAKLIWCTLSPASPPSLGVATIGVLISAPRPLPKPERAMRLRLPVQTDQSNLDVIRSGTRGFVVATLVDSAYQAVSLKDLARAWWHRSGNAVIEERCLEKSAPPGYKFSRRANPHAGCFVCTVAASLGEAPIPRHSRHA